MMLPFAKPAGPCIIWRSPGVLRGTRKAEYGNTVAEGRKYEVLERAREGGWIVVTELTVVDGRPQVAA
jgi:hypothetical protein